jgi:hypothetical protein
MGNEESTLRLEKPPAYSAVSDDDLKEVKEYEIRHQSKFDVPALERPEDPDSQAAESYQQTMFKITIETMDNMRDPISRYETPQWNWPRLYCRIWLFKFISGMFGLSSQKAYKCAMKFDGCGATLYLMKLEVWKKIIDDIWAETIYSVLVGMRGNPGAMPSSVQVSKVKALSHLELLEAKEK